MREQLAGVAGAVVAVIAAWLPSRYWPALDGLPIRRMALISALATLGLGFGAGMHGSWRRAPA
ncbi:MAG TPA: hypothetical protein VNJ02_01540 [Vicinamibacterales bacterium]|nr:hypothetical protein [Vicinamibacterales bacterium]